MQQLSLSLNLCRRATLVLLLQVNDAVVPDLATAIKQTPLGIQNRRLVSAGVQTGNRQKDLHIRREAGISRCQHYALAVQAPGQLTDQQLIDICRQAASPAAIGRCGQAAIGLALQQGLALQVVGDRYRAEHDSHARALLGLARLTTVELIQGYRLVHAATGQTEYAAHQQNKRKAQKFHHPIQAAATRLTAVILI
ncbi:hypothetical protein D3C72_1503660 [compost metagenome]